uniref:Uncharacterized protein n=1 Tax=Arundo donax TaxID=35708 RepID=A0A0A8ZP74_ARUDO
MACPTRSPMCDSEGPRRDKVHTSEHTMRIRAPALFTARSLERRRAEQAPWHPVWYSMNRLVEGLRVRTLASSQSAPGTTCWRQGA